VNDVDKRTKLPLALELPAAAGLALMAGFLFNMSVVTAPALNGLSPEQAPRFFCASELSERMPTNVQQLE
jgi:uncharacterized membrane protein